MKNRATSFEVDGRDHLGRPMMARPIEVTDEDERDFQIAMESYKRQSGRNFPTWSEILEVLQSLGYAKRIWKPVGTWSPIPGGVMGQEADGGGGEVGIEMFGWFTSVETPIGP